MFRHYLLLAWRVLWRRKVFTIINGLGLATGISAFLLIGLFVTKELGFDRFFDGSGEIYRVETQFTFADGVREKNAIAGGPVKAALDSWYPGATAVARLYQSGATVALGDRLFNESVSYADPGFLEIFELEFIAGGPAGAIADISSMAISQSMATKYFGDAPAIGKSLTVGGQRQFRVTAVFRDLPATSHMELKFLVRFDEERFQEMASRWFWTNFYTYIRFPTGTDINAMSKSLPGLVDKHAAAEIEGSNIPGAASDTISLFLVPLHDLHLKGGPQNTMKPVGSLPLIRGLIMAAFFILILAATNFINLSTARSSVRAREVTLRKVFGAKRHHLVAQYLLEALILIFLSLLLGLGLLELSLPFANAALGEALTLEVLYGPAGFLGLFAGALFLGLAVGAYPAFYLTRAKPAEVLLHNRSNPTGTRLRNGLSILQFSIAIALLQITAVVYSQTQYARSFDPGFERTDRLVLRGLGRASVEDAQQPLKQALLASPASLGVSYSYRTPSDEAEYTNQIIVPGRASDERLALTVQSVDHDFFQTYGSTLLAGRFLSDSFARDTARERGSERYRSQANAIINRAALGKIGISDAKGAIGLTIGMNVGSPSPPVQLTIVGVVENMHFRSIRSSLRPSLFWVDEPLFQNLTIHFKESERAGFLDQVRKIWSEHAPDQPIRFETLESNLDRLYGADETAYRLLLAAAVLALLVASLGLYGVTIFQVERRTREIGIRKVLGAKLGDIVGLLTWQLSKPVLFANLLAWPVAVYLMSSWLEGFVYRIELGVSLLFAPAGLVLVFSTVIVVVQTLRAGHLRPVETLRHE